MNLNVTSNAIRALRRAASFGALALFALIAAGCGNGGSGDSGSANIRFFNAIVDVASVNVTVGDTAAVAGLPFEGLTEYREFNAGNQEIKVTVPGGTSAIIDQLPNLGNDTNYTYIMYGTASAPGAQIVSDTVTLPSSGQFVIRATNAAFGSLPFDVYVTAPGASLDSLSPNISGVALNGTSAFATLTSGSLQLRLTLANSKQVIYDAGTIAFAGGAAYYVVGYTKGSGTLVNAALLDVNLAGSGRIANSTLAQFKMVHAAPGTAAINALVDGTVTLANIPYQNASGYVLLPSGAHTVTVETATSPGAVIAAAQAPFSASTDTSIFVTGTPGAQAAVVLDDNNLPGTAGRARVRFVNAAVGVGAVDVLINFARRVSNLDPNAASSYLELTEDTYAIDFALAGTTNVVRSTSISVSANRTYTLYLVGTSGQLDDVLTRDD
jgi:hypothetical protein